MAKRDRLATCIRIGARASDLAQIQAKQVGNAIQNFNPNLQITYSFYKSQGDRDLRTPIYDMGARGVFTRDLTYRLLTKQVDVVIHSYKDLELQSHPQTQVLPVLHRGDPRDLLLMKRQFLTKPGDIKRWHVYTSSLRRAYNFSIIRERMLPLRLRQPRFEIQSIRGNVSTRLRKLYRETEPSMLIVAKAAVDRLLNEDSSEFIEIAKEMRFMMNQFMFMVLPLSLYPTAAGQGALAAEVLNQQNEALLKLLESLTKPDCNLCVEQERERLRDYGGGCQQEIGITCLKKDYGMITFIRGRSLDGKVLAQKTLERIRDIPIMKKNHAFPLPNHKSEQQTQRKPVPLPTTQIPNNLYISRIDAIPQNWLKDLQGNPDCIIGCPGNKTAMQLAEKDIWVHGAADSLGETGFPDFTRLLGRPVSFVKLTHTQPVADNDQYMHISSYELQICGPTQMLTDVLPEKKIFFWSSPAHFAYYRAWLPKGKEKERDLIHCCGPGITASYLRNQHGLEAIMFLSYEDWLSSLV